MGWPVFKVDSATILDASHKVSHLFPCFILVVVLSFSTASVLFGQCPENCYPYQVDEPETIRDIAIHFGSEKFSDLISEVNPHLEEITGPIPTGTLLFIPAAIWNFKGSDLTANDVINAPWGSAGNTRIDGEILQEDSLSNLNYEQKLESFREAFNALVESDSDSVEEEKLREAERELFLELDGMVIDDTRSKIGRDFYDVFFQRWTPPENIYNYTIRISEQPSPSLGSLITVHLNDIETFRYRLPPRYETIQQAAAYAVVLTYRHLVDEQPKNEIY